MAAGLVDRGNWGGGGKIWQRGGPGRGGGGGAVAAAVAAAVVLVAVAAAVVSTTAVEDQGQPLVGSFLRSGGDDAPTPSAHLVTFWREKKGSSTNISTCRKPLKSYQIILSKLNAITCLTITLKWSVTMM